MDRIPEESFIDERKLARVTHHLELIDPVLVPLARTISQPPYKDLTTPEKFLRGWEDTLEPKDLVLTHLTDYFPEGGIIRAAAFYYPETLHFTVHTAVNAFAPDIPPDLGGHTWRDKKYAVLIPFEKVQARALAFNPADTFFLEEIVLPQGAIVLKDPSDPAAGALGNAQLIEADYSQPGKRLTGIQRVVYEQIVKMGYFPQEVFPVGGWLGWGDGSYVMDFWRKFCGKYGINFASGYPHASHWSGRLADTAFLFNYNPGEEDETTFIATVEEAKELLEDQTIPSKYRQKLAEFIESYKTKYFPQVELPELAVIDEKAERAKKKIIDLEARQSEGQTPLVHSTTPEGVVMILDAREGIISPATAERELGYRLRERYRAIGRFLSRKQKADPEKVDITNVVSVNDFGGRAIVSALRSEEFTQGVNFLLSPSLRQSANFHKDVYKEYREAGLYEAFIEGGIAAEEIIGVIVDPEYSRTAVNLVIQDIFHKGSHINVEGLRKHFLAWKSGDTELDELRTQYPVAKDEFEEALLRYALYLGYNPQDPRAKEDYHYLFSYLPGVQFNMMQWGGTGKLPATEYSLDTDRNIQEFQTFVQRVQITIKESKEKGEKPDLKDILNNLASEMRLDLWTNSRWNRWIIPSSEALILKTLESVLETRVRKLELERQIWRRYIEKISGTEVERATVGDLLLGICKKAEVPFYSSDGEVLWPK